jgi:hypothetical protein
VSNQSHLNAQGSDQHERSSRNKAFGLEPCFHFNNRKYADDDLIVGSVNPLELFLIFAELGAGGDHAVGPGGIRLTIDQSHNVEAKVEAMVLSVLNLQDAYAKSLLIDRAGLAQAQDYFARHAGDGDDISDPDPRVVLIENLGMVTVGQTAKAARISRDLYHRAIEVMAGAGAVSEFVSLTESESFAVEYWPLELYKLSLAPPLGELQGRVALVTGAAGGIGRAVLPPSVGG